MLWTKPNPTNQKLKNLDPTRPNPTQPMGQPNPWTTLSKSIRPVKLSDEVLMWLSVWSEVHIVCIWSSWCRCIPKPHHLLPHLNPYWFYLSSTGIPRLSLKIDVVLAFIPQRTSYTFQRAMDRHIPPEVSLPDGDLVLHVRTFSMPARVRPQTAFRSLQLFWRDSRSWPSHRKADHAAPSAAVSRICAMHAKYCSSTLIFIKYCAVSII